MKKELLLVFCSLGSLVLMADIDLPAKKFSPATGGTSEVVRGEDFFSKAVKLTAGKDSPALAAYSETFPFSTAAVYKVSAEIKGQGSAFIVFEILNSEGNVVTSHKIAGGEATGRFRDLKGRFDGRMWRARIMPKSFRIVLGVEKGASVTFDDVELEIDKD